MLDSIRRFVAERLVGGPPNQPGAAAPSSPSRVQHAACGVMWGVILADGRLSDHETHLVRKMASLMQLEPAYLAQARKAAAGET